MKEEMFACLNRFVPAEACAYCASLWEKHPFSFKVTRSRRTKLGDYRYDPRSGHHTITVNGTLNSYAFLVTYLHEYAHLLVRKRFEEVKPHGKEWKKCFQEVMEPVLNQNVFPDSVLDVLREHMRNPMASSQADPKLAVALHELNKEQNGAVPLMSLKLGDSFVYRNSAYQRREQRRTRVVCTQLETGKNYLFSASVFVEVLNPEAFEEMKQQRTLGTFEQLHYLDEGTVFQLGKRIFKKKKLRRTRVLCEDLNNRREYLIHKDARVKVLEELEKA